MAGSVLDYSPDGFRKIWGLIASPPCQSFSSAGKGAGRRDLDLIYAAVSAIAEDEPWEHIVYGCSDPRTKLVLIPLIWALYAEPEWIALEQVPPVLPVWEAFAIVLRERGYYVDTKVISSEQYGVPQTRRRAILIAHRRRPVKLPDPTHRAYKKGVPQHEGDQALRPWVSMAEALGWGMTARPSTTLVTGNNGGGPDPMSGGSGSRAVHARERESGAFIECEFLVGFPRLADTKTNRCPANDIITIDGVDYRARDFRASSEPAFALTEKARSWTLQSRRDSPAWVREHGTRENRALSLPAPTMTGEAHRWKLRNNTSAKAGVRTEDEPAPTMYFGDRLNKMSWELRGSTMPNATHRRVDEPAHTIAFGKDAASCKWHPTSKPTVIKRRRPKRHWSQDRPATTVGADRARLGEDEANARYGDRAGTKAVRIQTWEAAMLQSFPRDYPWQGSKTRQFTQVGNAMPPLLAWHVLSSVLG